MFTLKSTHLVILGIALHSHCCLGLKLQLHYDLSVTDGGANMISGALPDNFGKNTQSHTQYMPDFLYIETQLSFSFYVLPPDAFKDYSIEADTLQ